MIFLYILLSVAVAEDKPGIFEHHKFERYKEILLAEEFDKLQVFVFMVNRRDGTVLKEKVEKYGIKSQDIIRVMRKKGALTREYFEILSNKKKTETQLRTIERSKVLAQVEAVSYIAENMPAELFLHEVFPSPTGVTIGIKNTWFYFF